MDKVKGKEIKGRRGRKQVKGWKGRKPRDGGEINERTKIGILNGYVWEVKFKNHIPLILNSDKLMKNLLKVLAQLKT